MGKKDTPDDGPEWLQTYHRLVAQFLRTMAAIEHASETPICTKIVFGIEVAELHNNGETAIVPYTSSPLDVLAILKQADFPTPNRTALMDTTPPITQGDPEFTPQWYWAQTLYNMGLYWYLLNMYENGLSYKQVAKHEGETELTVTNGIAENTTRLTLEEGAEDGFTEDIALSFYDNTRPDQQYRSNQ